MPRELKPLYHHLLGLIDPIYMLWASKAFQIVRTVQERSLVRDTPRFRGVTSSPTSDELNVCLFFLAISEKHFSVDALSYESLHDQVYRIVQTFTEDFITAKSKYTPVQLTARCAGLLEVLHFEDFGIYSRIQWIYRTARDFLEHDDVWSSILNILPVRLSILIFICSKLQYYGLRRRPNQRTILHYAQLDMGQY